VTRRRLVLRRRGARTQPRRGVFQRMFDALATNIDVVSWPPRRWLRPILSAVVGLGLLALGAALLWNWVSGLLDPTTASSSFSLEAALIGAGCLLAGGLVLAAGLASWGD